MTYDEKLMRAKYLIEEKQEWSKWSKEIPFIAFPPDWLVKAIPAFGGAIIRYNIKHKDKPDSFVSIYLDCYNELGLYPEPYWEVYPVGEDTHRMSMNDVDELIRTITQALEEQ